MPALPELRSGDFARLLNQTFRLYPARPFPFDNQAELPPLLLTLEEVTELSYGSGSASPPLDRQPFSLVFRAPNSIYLPQRIYTLEHEQLGQLDIFLVPIGADREGMRYEAIFT